MGVRSVPRTWKVAATLCLLSPAAVAGQTARGLVTRADSGEPLAGALVEVVDADGARVVGALSGPEGRYRLSLTGGVNVRASFVGMIPRIEAVGALALADTLLLDLVLEPRAMELGGLSVVAEERCGGNAFDAVEIGRVWEEARTALQSIEWAADASVFRYDVETHVRRLDARARRVLSESSQDLPAWGPHPFRSPPPAELANRGYVQEVEASTMYYAPDVEALLSEDFLETHCFALAPDRDDTSSVGLSFRPIDGRAVPDIIGTFWLDAETTRLRELTFRYTGLDRDIDTSEIGGQIDFGTVEGGGWIVEAWAIRMPVIGLQPVAGSTDRREVVTAIEEHGGAVRRVRRAGQAIWAGEETGVLQGRVVREASYESSAGIEVRLGGTAYVTRTDGSGAFALRGLRDGLYELQVYDSILDALGLDTLRAPVRPTQEASSGRASESEDGLVVRLPSFESEVARRCAALDQGQEMAGAALSGSVLDELSGVAVPDATIRASWRRVDRMDETGLDRTLEWTQVTSDGAGRFVFCSLPANHEVTVLASAFGRSSAGRNLRFGGDEVHDVRLTLTAGDPVTVTGRIRSEAGSSLGGAEVSVGPYTTLSGDDGRFHLGDVAPGLYPVAVSHLGRASVGDSVRVAGGAENHVDVVMPEPTFELQGLDVEVTRGSAVRYRTQDTRVDVMTREQIEAVTFGKTSIAGVLQHSQVPGLTAFETQFPITDTNYLRTRLGICIQIGRNAGAGCRMPEVYLNGLRLPRPHFDLLSIDVLSLDRLELLSAIEAQALYPNARYGVLLIYTR